MTVILLSVFDDILMRGRQRESQRERQRERDRERDREREGICTNKSEREGL